MGKIYDALSDVVEATEKTAGVLGMGIVAEIITQGTIITFTDEITENMDDGAMKTGIRVGGYVIATVCGIGAGWATLDIASHKLKETDGYLRS